MQVCDLCKSLDCEVIDRSIPGVPYTGWPWAWLCNNCGASVGCKMGTTEPLGFMASSQVRRMRHIAHTYFDSIWRAGYMSRVRAQEWMREQLELDCEFHIAQINYNQLAKCISLSKAYIDEKSKKVPLSESIAKRTDKINRRNDKIRRDKELQKNLRIKKRYK